jgi:hypothetical protein
VKLTQNKNRSILAIALAAIVVSPLDDIALSALFGTAFFGFGSTAFYMLLTASSAVSVLVWKRHALARGFRRLGSFLLHKLS